MNPQSAKIEIALPDRSTRTAYGTCRKISRRILELSADDPIPVRAAISVEYEDVLFIGEVLTCEPKAEGHCQITVEVKHVLTGLQRLMILRERLMKHHVCAVCDQTKAASA